MSHGLILCDSGSEFCGGARATIETLIELKT
jgi:hypothetical protein